MNKQILIIIASLLFCKTGLSITGPEAARFGLSALLSQPNIRNYNQYQRINCLSYGDIVPVFLSPIASALYNHCLTDQTAHANTVSEVKKVQTSLASNIDASNKQTTAQMKGLEQRLDRLILCNTKLIEFLAQKDHTIVSTQDALTLVDKSKQLLEEELISKTERIAFLENALKSLKEKMEELAVENESIRAELEASIQGLQLKLKQ